MQRTKKFILSIFIAGGLGLYNWQSNGHKDTPQASTLVAPRVISTAVASYKDGTFTGKTSDAYYGYVQVQAFIQGGRISDVHFLQYPKDHHQSDQISEVALPRLKQEVIQAQVAKVDGITGATETSQAFTESMQSALNQARL